MSTLPVHRCRSCGAPIRWARTTKGGWMQLDALMVPAEKGGRYSVIRDQGQPLACAVPERKRAARPLYQPHACRGGKVRRQ